MKEKVLVSLATILLMFSITFAPTVHATNYQPGVKPGMFFEYEFEHFSDIEKAVLYVKSVENQTITFDVLITTPSGEIKNETLIFSVGKDEAVNMTVVLAAVNKSENWKNILGTNQVTAEKDAGTDKNYVQIVAQPTESSNDSEKVYEFKNVVGYEFEELQDFSNILSINFDFYADGSGSFWFWIRNSDNYTIVFPIEYPRKEYAIMSMYLWKSVSIGNFTSSDFDFKKINAIGISYNSTTQGFYSRTIRLSDITAKKILHEPCKHRPVINKIEIAFEFIVISAGLRTGDRIYPDEMGTITIEESDVVQHAIRNVVVKKVEYDGVQIVEHRWDAETGMLLRFWYKASWINVELRLTRTNAWEGNPWHIHIYIYEGWVLIASVIWAARIPICTAAAAFFGFFAFIQLRDRIREKGLGEWKIYLPLLIILLVMAFLTPIITRYLR